MRERPRWGTGADRESGKRRGGGGAATEDASCRDTDTSIAIPDTVVGSIVHVHRLKLETAPGEEQPETGTVRRSDKSTVQCAFKAQ